LQDYETAAMELNLKKPLGQVLADMQTRIVNHSHYFGVKTLKNPLDFWIYREMIFEHRPDVIVEIGTFNGGSALAFAHILDVLDHGQVISIDLDHAHVPKHIRFHPRITLLEGDACQMLEEVKTRLPDDPRILLFEDSAHTYANTLNIMKAYRTFIQPGDYMVIEDTICHHGLNEGPSPCGFEAVEDFLKFDRSFELDRQKENFGITWNPNGFVRRKGLKVQKPDIQGGVVHGSSSYLRALCRVIYIQVMPPILVGLVRKCRAAI